jgi:2-(1,2-epoxy-1,2-dihydrophenyl)acetyl-CoA isomerase
MSEALHSYHPKIRVEREDHVVTVTLDAPQSRNACTGGMWVAIGRTFREIPATGARVLVLTGAGGNFSSGADLTGGDEPPAEGPPAGMLESMRVISDVALAVYECPIPVVAKVDGLCVGAALGLAMATDITVCSDRSRFSAIFAKRGLSLDFGTSWFLSRRIGVHRAKELAFTAKMLSGPEAYELGMVNSVVPETDLDAAVAELAGTIAAGPPIALSMSKREIDHAMNSTLAQALEAEALAQSVNVKTRDTREALMAFAERRPPVFTGQ